MGGHALMLALRSGIVGISLACIVYVLWKLDCRYNHDLKLDRNAKRLVLLLGVMLWTVWFCNCQIVMIASEEAKNFAYNQDFEP